MEAGWGRRVRVALHEGWTVRAVGGPVPEGIRDIEVAASVPGCVTTDLLAAGLIPDPYLDDNERRLGWIGRTDWCFRTGFEAAAAAAGERVDLVCEGLDTVATVELNGVVLGRTANMHRSYRFDARPALRAGPNELRVSFVAPISYAERMSAALGPRPHTNTHPFNAIRKMACNFGWDWGPDLATAGIWRPIGLERWRHVRLASVRPLVEVDTATDRPDGRVSVHVKVEWAGGSDGAVHVAARVDEVAATATVVPPSTGAVVEVSVPEPKLWWPTGYGSQPLYDVTVDLRAADLPPSGEGSPSAGGSPASEVSPSGGDAVVGHEDDGRTGRDATGPLDTWHGRIGLRSVRLDTTADADGERFAIIVNGRPIAVRGANWIPDDCFVHRVGPSRYRRGMADAVEANMNLLRVWGGGIYESDDFYDAADEAGLLVWQDFLFACAAYSEDEPLRAEVVAEARQAVARLVPHPSLAVWNGCNENLWGHEDWGWKRPLAGRSWGAGYYDDVLPDIVAELDPTRPYTPGSPWSPGAGRHPNDPRYGTTHVWDVWNQKDYTAYRQITPRFVTEFGFQGPPAWSTLTRAVHDDPLTPDGPALAAHQKAADGMAKLERGLAGHFPTPTSMEDWHWATSLNQARAVVMGVEHWRSCTPRCSGIVVWQLNDCWPVISWASVDGDGHRKPLWYALRRSYLDRLLTVQPGEAGLALVAVNDSDRRWTATLEVTRQDFDGTVRGRGTVRVDAGEGCAVAFPLDPAVATAGDPAREVLVVGAGAERALWFYREDKDLALPPPELGTHVRRVGDGYEVALTARTLQRDVALLADKVVADAVVDDMVVTLLAGESARLHLRTAADIDPQRLVSADVLRSANQLLHPAAGAR
jgi:beta-mannosidase